jgi:hypothetical protein
MSVQKIADPDLRLTEIIAAQEEIFDALTTIAGES